MLIQVDVDSTLYDADPVFEKYALEQGIKWPRRAKNWLPAEMVQKVDGSFCTRDDLVKVFRKAHSKEVVATNKPYPNAAKVLQGIAQDFPEIEIAYVSDRNEQQTAALRDWLDANGFLINEDIHVAATKDKRHWMRERKPEIVIDDRVRTIIMARFELDSYVVSLEHNHNMNLFKEFEGIEIVKDWKAIDEVLRTKFIPNLEDKLVTRELALTR